MFSISYSSKELISQSLSSETLGQATLGNPEPINSTSIKIQLNDTIGFIQNKEYEAADGQLSNLFDSFNVTDSIPLPFYGEHHGFISLPVIRPAIMSELTFDHKEILDVFMLIYYANLAFQNGEDQISLANLKLAYQILEGKSYLYPNNTDKPLPPDLNITSFSGNVTKEQNVTNLQTFRLFHDSLNLPYLEYPLGVHIDWPLFGILGVGPVKLTVQNIDTGTTMFDEIIESGLLPSDDFYMNITGHPAEQVNACINVININITQCTLYLLPPPVAYQQYESRDPYSTLTSFSRNDNPLTPLDFFIDNYPVQEIFPYPVIKVNITRLQP